MGFRMITSMSGNNVDLPYGTLLIEGEVDDFGRRQISTTTAERWLLNAVIERVQDNEPPRAEITTTNMEPPIAPGRIRLGRKKAS